MMDLRQKQKHLADEYETLSKQEDNLRAILDQLKREEELLREALKEASESGQERLQKQQDEKNAAAIKRLEEALLDDDSSSNGNEGDHGTDKFDLSSMIDVKSMTSGDGQSKQE
mmetsp:Transcript_14080/g.21507  ORF Transcript_14080/g.21507 Transcript_14080/m.21507 type:complete len:114 (-) Transcript_14080:777-1118(-)